MSAFNIRVRDVKLTRDVPAYDKERNIALIVLKSDTSKMVVCDEHRIVTDHKMMYPIKNVRVDIVTDSRFLKENVKQILDHGKIGTKVITKFANSSFDERICLQTGFKEYGQKIFQDESSEYGILTSAEILTKANSIESEIVKMSKIFYKKETLTSNPVSCTTLTTFCTLKFISTVHMLKFYGTMGLSSLVTGLFFIIWIMQTFNESAQIVTNISLIGMDMTIFATILAVTGILLFLLTSERIKLN